MLQGSMCSLCTAALPLKQHRNQKCMCRLGSYHSSSNKWFVVLGQILLSGLMMSSFCLMIGGSHHRCMSMNTLLLLLPVMKAQTAPKQQTPLKKSASSLHDPPVDAYIFIYPNPYAQHPYLFF